MTTETTNQPVINANDTMCPTCGLWFNARCWGDRPDCDGHNEPMTDGPVDETEEDREWVKSERPRLVADQYESFSDADSGLQERTMNGGLVVIHGVEYEEGEAYPCPECEEVCESESALDEHGQCEHGWEVLDDDDRDAWHIWDTER